MRERRIQLKRLKGYRDLDNYVFADDKHAASWLKQSFVNDEEYGVQIITAGKRPCCGQLYAIKVHERLTPSQFLKRQ